MKVGNNNFVVGEKDTEGRNIRFIHSSSNDKYVIYETNENSLAWNTSSPELSKSFREFSVNTIRLSFIAGKSKSLKIMGVRFGARALTLVAQGSIELAQSVIDEGERKMLRLKNIEGKLHYLSSCMITMLVIVIIALFVFNLKGISLEFLTYLSVIVCGSIGSFLSVTVNLGKVEVDVDAPWSLNIISGISRILIGIISSLLIYFLIKANIIFGVVAQSNSEYAILAICILAGFSETLIPNILKKIETQQ